MRKGFPNHNHGPSKKRELRTGPETVAESQEPLQRLFCLEWQLLASLHIPKPKQDGINKFSRTGKARQSGDFSSLHPNLQIGVAVCVSIYHLSTGTEWRLALTSKCSSLHVFHKAFCASSCKRPKTQVGFQKGQVSPNAACLTRGLCFGTNGLLFQDLVMSHDSFGLI